MARLTRLDTELVRRQLAPSRNQAAALISDGKVKVDGQVVTKPARQVNPAQAILVSQDQGPNYVSRGAHKLAGALDILAQRGIEATVAGRQCLDAGASTGGFTDVLLRRGAARVTAADVGYGQLAWSLQSDPRVNVMDRTNVRTLAAGDITPAPTLVVSDLSFISLTLVLPALVAVADDAADFLLMVKPQFEVGKELIGHGGVVRDVRLHAQAITKVATCALELGLSIEAVAPLPLPGPAGNVEYFLYMHAGTENSLTAADLQAEIEAAIISGPAGKGAKAKLRR